MQTVFENGTYTFKVVEITTGKEYTKSVQVSNIDTSMQDYYVAQDLDKVYLLDKTTDEPIIFESAYIIYNDERININSCIEETDGMIYIDILRVSWYLEDIGKISDRHDDLLYTIQKFEIIKNGKSYYGDITMTWAE